MRMTLLTVLLATAACTAEVPNFSDDVVATASAGAHAEALVLSGPSDYVSFQAIVGTWQLIAGAGNCTACGGAVPPQDYRCNQSGAGVCGNTSANGFRATVQTHFHGYNADGTLIDYTCAKVTLYPSGVIYKSKSTCTSNTSCNTTYNAGTC